MHNLKKLGLLAMGALLCFALLFSACGEKKPDETGINSNEATYRVTVVDDLGNFYTDGVVVRFLQDGEPVAMQVVDGNGVAEKVLPKGSYGIDLVFTGNEDAYHFDSTGLTLTAEKPELSVILEYAVTGEPVNLFAQGQDTSARNIGNGCTYVTLTAGQRNYFLFTPAVAGTYEFSVVGNVEQLGYYGSPHFVQGESIAEAVDNAFTVSVSAGMIGTGGGGTTTLVIGIDAGSSQDCVVCAVRIGEPERTLDDEPWIIYTPTAELKAYKMPAGATVHEFDLTASADAYNLVYNENDGLYHLDSADGPLVLVRLAVNNPYMDCFKKVLENSGVSKYFFDENGEFIKRESYDQCLLEYLNYVDEDSGMYPLTEDLKYIIQQRGDHYGWYDSDSPGYLFLDQNGNWIPGINPDISWLFMCCYITEG
ncbi:MAG: hypothetical protein ACI3W5_06405 [Faecousia sp.]